MLKDFDTIINLIENGTVKVSIKIGIHLDEKRYIKTYDHGCGFAIDEFNLPKLYYTNLYSSYLSKRNGSV